MSPDEALEWVRSTCLALPNAIEKLSHGAPCFFHEKGKQFAAFVHNHHGDERLAIWVPAPPGIQDSLIQENPRAYFRPPYVGPSGWVGICLDRDLAIDEIADLIQEAHTFTAKKSSMKRTKGIVVS